MLVQRLPKEKYLGGLVTLDICLRNKFMELAVFASAFNEFHWLITALGANDFLYTSNLHLGTLN